MTTRRALLLTTVATAGVLVPTFCGCSPWKDGFRAEYRMQVTVGPTTYWGMGATRFAELVAEKTGGRVVVKPYFGSQLLKGAQLNSSQMVASGAIDCAFESTINTAPVVPDMDLFSLPFYIRTYDRVDRLEAGKTGQLLFDRMREKGLEPLAWGENGFRQLTNSKRAVRRPEDLRGLRVRVVGSPIFVDIFRTLGADPVNMNWGDAVTSFQQGTVDGQENPGQILLAVQIHRYHNHMTAWNYVIDPLVLYWNRKQFEAFPEDVRQAIREAAAEATAYQKALARAGLDDGRAAQTLQQAFDTEAPADPMAELRSHGCEIVELTDVEADAFADLLAPVRQAWAGKLGPDIRDAATADLGDGP